LGAWVAAATSTDAPLTSCKPTEYLGSVPLQELAFWFGFFPARYCQRNTMKPEKKLVQFAGAVQS